MTTQKYESHSDQQKSAKSSVLGTQVHAAKEITQEQREHMIAEAAYYLAEHRHFKGGDPARDWLQAQTEIDRKIGRNRN
jgi:hypothetical protein